MDETEVLIQLKKNQIERAEKKLDVLYTELHELHKKCPHTKLVSKSKHFEGTYYDVAETMYWDECTVCSKELNERSKTHYYG